MHIVLEVPERFLIAEDAAELGRRVALYASLLMYRSGEFSAGAAAEFAGVDRFAFVAECQRHGIPSVSYPPSELGAELESLRPAS